MSESAAQGRYKTALRIIAGQEQPPLEPVTWDQVLAAPGDSYPPHVVARAALEAE